MPLLPIKIQRKRNYRKIRSKIKSSLKRFGKPNIKLRIKYNVASYTPYKPLSSNEQVEIKIPKDFCLIEDHESVFDFFRYLDRLLARKRPFHLYINHDSTRKIGLTASFLFDKKISIYERKWKKRGINIILSGSISESKEVNNFLLSFGLLSKIKFQHNFGSNYFDTDYKNKYETLHKEGSNIHDYLKGNASTELVDYFDKCLNFSHYCLTADGKGMLVDAIGEIIGNAEEHSGLETTKWDVLGCYNKDSHYCTFAIINDGNSIYESLSNNESTSAHIISKIEKVIHSNMSIFSRIGKIHSGHEETIWNVMALQDGISSKRKLEGVGRTRGQGLMDFIDFISNVRSANDMTSIAIISGKSKINIDFTYPIIYPSEVNPAKERRKIIFNDKADLHYPQDPSKVLLMPHKFSGTIITGTFKINETYLKESLERKKWKN